MNIWYGWAEALTRHDWDAVCELLAPDGVYEDRTGHTRVQGREAMRAYLVGLETGFSSDFSIEVADSIETGDRYAVEYVWRGTHDGSSQDMPATGKRFEVTGVEFGRLESGRIAEMRDYWDVPGFLTQVGLTPQPAAAATR